MKAEEEPWTALDHLEHILSLESMPQAVCVLRAKAFVVEARRAKVIRYHYCPSCRHKLELSEGAGG